MKAIELNNGTVVLTVEIKVVITRYDLVAVACYALAHHRLVKSRKALVALAKRIIENRGVSIIVSIMQKYNNVHLENAESLVLRLFPEMTPKPVPAHLAQSSTN